VKNKGKNLRHRRGKEVIIRAGDLGGLRRGGGCEVSEVRGRFNEVKEKSRRQNDCSARGDGVLPTETSEN